MKLIGCENCSLGLCPRRLGMSQGQANFALTVLLATTLVGKVHEGWNRITEGNLCNTLDKLPLTDELQEMKTKITECISSKIFLRIRNSIAFHYPKRGLDFSKLKDHITDFDTTIYMSPQSYVGDVLSQVSTLAGIEPILALNPDSGYRSLELVWREVLDVTHMYSEFVASAMVAVITSSIQGISAERLQFAMCPSFRRMRCSSLSIRREILKNSGALPRQVWNRKRGGLAVAMTRNSRTRTKASGFIGLN